MRLPAGGNSVLSTLKELNKLWLLAVGFQKRAKKKKKE
jgi:hypothetical protein